MPNVVGAIPEFTQDETSEPVVEVKEEGAPEAPKEEKATPPEPPAETKPAESEKPSGDSGELARGNQALQEERVKLLKEISELRGQRREIKQEQLAIVQQQIDDLKDVNPQDVDLIDRVLRSKGYMTKDESSRMFYEAVKQEELSKFLEKYPEYKPENDPGDANWSRLQSELSFYRRPDDPHGYQVLLERAHRVVAPIRVSPDRGTAVQKHQAQVAGVGAGGTQRSSSTKSLDPDRRSILERGGWSEAEIKEIEKNL